MAPDEITADWLASVLGGEIGSVTQQRIGDGHIGVNLRVELRDAAPGLPASVVVKLPALDQTSLMTAAMLRH
jgi:hypothetical protein